jgi:hypothetical protein
MDAKSGSISPSVDSHVDSRAAPMALVVATPRSQWVADSTVTRCELCRLDFGVSRRKHHCRLCGHIFCQSCSDFFAPALESPAEGPLERRCRRCFDAYTRSEKEKAGAAVQEAATTAAALRAAEAEALTRRHSRLTRIEASVLDSGRTFAHGLPAIGRRAELEKGYFLCRQSADGGAGAQEVLLAIVRPRRRNLRFGEEMREFLLGLHHPFVMPALDLIFFPENETATHDGEPAGEAPVPISLGVFRSIAAWGSLLDVMHSGADPALPAATKYAAARQLGTPLPQERLALYGRQILEAVVFLQSVWVSCAGVTTSNVLVLSDDWCLVTDWENDLLGMKSSSARYGFDLRGPVLVSCVREIPIVLWLTICGILP